MATFENTVVIGRPIEEVFAFLSDFENVPRWNYAIVETRKVSQGPVGVGTIYQQVRSVPSRSEERFAVTAYDPPRQLELRGQLGPFPSRLSYALGAVPEGTPVTNTVELELHGPGRLLGESPCHVSGTPSPPTSGSSRNCWSNRGTPGRGFTPAARSCS
jgi:uncharacterized protein YndB with AHSA1/START domain